MFVFFLNISAFHYVISVEMNLVSSLVELKPAVVGRNIRNENENETASRIYFFLFSL